MSPLTRPRSIPGRVFLCGSFTAPPSQQNICEAMFSAGPWNAAPGASESRWGAPVAPGASEPASSQPGALVQGCPSRTSTAVLAGPARMPEHSLIAIRALCRWQLQRVGAAAAPWAASQHSEWDRRPWWRCMGRCRGTACSRTHRQRHWVATSTAAGQLGGPCCRCAGGSAAGCGAAVARRRDSSPPASASASDGAVGGQV